MQESKQETQFRIGGVYRAACGAVVEVFSNGKSWGDYRQEVLNGINLNGRAGSNNGQWLPDGRYYNGPGRCADMAIIPGELHQVDGQWLPLEEKQEEKTELRRAVERMAATPAYKALTDPNAAMIARDGPAKPKTCTCGEPHNQGVIHRTDGPCYFKAQPITTKPPIAGLTRVSAQDHRVGGWKV